MFKKYILIFFVNIILFELLFRAVYTVLYLSPYFKPSDVIYHYYPQVKSILQEYDNSKKEQTKILVLSSSALTDEWGGYLKLLQSKMSKSNITFYNASGVGFTSLDNYITFSLLKKENLNFDYIIFYNSINDARLNNCPEEIYKENYTHISWNNEIDCILNHPEINFTVIPFTLDFIFTKLYQNIFRNKFIPRNYKENKEWQNYGENFKSLIQFKNNVKNIITISSQDSKILLLSYCYYLPNNYSYNNFIEKHTNYIYETKSREANVWGIPKNVTSFIDSSSSALHKLSFYKHVYYYNIQKDLSVNNNFADICHYSKNGMSNFINANEEILKNFIDK